MKCLMWNIYCCSRFDIDEACFEMSIIRYSNICSREDDTSEGTSNGCIYERSWNVEGCSGTYKVIRIVHDSIHSEISSFRENEGM